MNSENQVLERIRAGDQTTIAELYSKCRMDFAQKLSRRWRSLSLDELSELYQDSFLRLLTLIDSGRLKSISKSWEALLCGIGNNIMLERSRADRKMPIQELKDFDLPQALEGIEQETFLSVLDTELKELDPRCQELIQLRIWQQLAFEAIFQKLNPSQLPGRKAEQDSAIAGIRVQYGRCVERLRKRVFEQLKNWGYGTEY